MLAREVQRVLEATQRIGRIVVSRRSGSPAISVEPRQRARKARPELAHRDCVALTGAGHRPQRPDRTVTIAAPMDAAPVAKALVVDDDAALRLLCRVNLELDGFAVREAATLAEAERRSQRERPDVVLLDVHLGGEETLELLDATAGRRHPGGARHRLGRRRGLPRPRRRSRSPKPFEPQDARRDRAPAR